MSTYEKGGKYLWVHKSTLACLFISRSLFPKGIIGLYTKKPKPAKDFHRCEITIVRTDREEKKLDARMQRRRDSLFKKLQTRKHIT